MDEHTRQQAFLTALVTEHFVQGSARAATITESNGRAAIYLSAVSSGLVAFGFLAQGPGRLDPFVAAVLPPCSSWASHLHPAGPASIEAAVLSLRPAIRGYYPPWSRGQQFFDPLGTDDALAVAMATSGNRASPVEMLFTAASMIARSTASWAAPEWPCWPARQPSWISDRRGHRLGRHGDPVRAAPAVWYRRAAPTAGWRH